MTRITFDNGVVDATALVWSIVALSFALFLLCIAMRLAYRRRAACINAAKKAALASLDGAIQKRYVQMNELTDPAHYAAWHAGYVTATEAMYGGPRCWGRFIRLGGQVPPVNPATGKLTVV
jgi:hypothetical protein